MSRPTYAKPCGTSAWMVWSESRGTERPHTRPVIPFFHPPRPFSSTAYAPPPPKPATSPVIIGYEPSQPSHDLPPNGLPHLKHFLPNRPNPKNGHSPCF